MRILLITHGLPPESVGGVEQHVDGLARALVEDGHDVHVLAKTGRSGAPQGTTFDEPAGTNDLPYPVTRIVYRYEGLESLRSLYRVTRMDEAVGEFLGRHDFDVAHIHHLTGLSTGLIEVLCDRGLPAVMTLHDYWMLCPRGQMWHREGRVVDEADPATCAECLHPTFGGWVPSGEDGQAIVRERLDDALSLLAACSALVVPSGRAKPPFVALGVPEDRIRVVENAVDTRALEILPTRPANPDQPLQVAYLGTLIPSKGLDVLVDAVTAQPKGTVELRIHGNAVPYHGDESFLTRVFSKLGPDDSVHYHGPYRTEELPELLAGVDLVCAPALWKEAYGLTPREALAAGRPVLVSAIGGLQDTVADGTAGRVLPPGDSEAWAKTIRHLAEDRSLVASMARAARKQHQPRPFAEMAGELLRLYRDVVGSRA